MCTRRRLVVSRLFYIAEGRSASSEPHKFSKPSAAVGSATKCDIFEYKGFHTYKENRCLRASTIFFLQKEGIFIKPISRKGLQALFDAKILKNTSRGFIACENNSPVGHYRTKGAAKQMYIEDRYANKAKSLVEGDMHR